MAYSALQLITRSLFLSQIVSRQLETPTGDQITDGLYLLNALLSIKASDLNLIPYFRQYNFTTADGSTVNGSWTAFIPNLLYVDTATFNIGTVRYPMHDLSRKQFFGTGRVDDIQSLPFSYRVERCLGGSNIYFYFVPADTYQFRIWGKFGLTEVTLQTDLSLTYDLFYIEYLRFAVAEYFCLEYGATFPDEAKEKYKEIREKLQSISPADLAIIKRTFFGGQSGYDWQVINLSRGWLPF